VSIGFLPQHIHCLLVVLHALVAPLVRHYHLYATSLADSGSTTLVNALNSAPPRYVCRVSPRLLLPKPPNRVTLLQPQAGGG
jgi:hypothetical protein